MDGHLYIGNDIDDYNVAVKAGKAASSTARLYLSVDICDVHSLGEEEFTSTLTGTFSCSSLSNDPLLILRGKLKLVSDCDTACNKNIIYEFDMLSV
jgi:hypothetical protein